MNISEALSIPLLIVDDRQENLLSMVGLLEGEGYEIVTAQSGNEALRLTLKHDFALLLLDVQMPDMDGFEAATLMRANPKTSNIPIIFVTAGMKELCFEFKGYDVGAVDYLTKPIEPVVLKSKVRVFAEMYRQRKELEKHKNNLDQLVAEKAEALLHSASELKERNRQLEESNRELAAIEEDMRGQIHEFVETHDQLLATEEMLRNQLAEYEQAQAELKESITNFKTIFNVSPLAFVVSLYPSGKIIEINSTFTDIFGYSRELVLGHTGLELGFWTDAEMRNRFLQAVESQGKISGFSADIRAFRGDQRKVLLYSSKIEYNHSTCLLIAFMDVTEQKMMEDQIRQSQKMDVLGQLAGGVAHDFNNMLTAILGSIELLYPHLMNNDKGMKLIGNIQQAATRSADLTQQLLSFSRKGQKDFVPLNLHETISETLTILEHTIDRKISLKTKLLAVNTQLTGNAALLQNALLNLGVNARDAMPDGGVITVATANMFLDENYCSGSPFDIKPGNYIELSVADTGIGIDQETVTHIFEPFFTTKEVGKGTGLGLASVYGTVKEHCGALSVFSEPGVGTVFKIYLPVAATIHKEEAKQEDAKISGIGILLVDDEDLIREIGKELLEMMGHKVFLAENGYEALEVYKKERENINLVILDLVMPKMGGRDTLKALRRLNPHVNVLIASGFNREGNWDELQHFGAKGFMTKPFTKNELEKAIAEAIEVKQ